MGIKKVPNNKAGNWKGSKSMTNDLTQNTQG